MEAERLKHLRELMVSQQLESRGITDQRVLDAMRHVPREAFVPADMAAHAHADNALPIGAGQTISQPYIVALMAQAAGVQPSDRVLDVGTGSGYGAAVLGRLARRVYSVERHELLARRAGATLARLGYSNIEVRTGDGSLGWVEAAPFDAIIVAASGRRIPPALLEQLTVGGRLVMPVGVVPHDQQLVCVRRVGVTGHPDEMFERGGLGPVAFVPLVEGDR